MTAVVTDAHYRMSVALIRDLGEAGVRVIACEKETFSDPVGFASRHAARCVRLPERGYPDALYALCREELEQSGEKPALLPVGAQTLAILAREQARFSAVCGLCIPSPEQLSLFNDKAAVAALAAKLGIAVPQSYEMAEGERREDFFARVALPCVVKPTCGEKFGLHAEARYRIARTGNELQSAYANFSALTQEAPVVQEFLPGGGLGCSVLCRSGAIICAIAHRRVREYPVTGGPSSCCEVMEPAPLLPLVTPLVRETSYTGLAMFELKEDAAGAPRLLEINPRVWGTYPLTRVSGSNFALCWLALSLGIAAPEYRAPRRVRMAFYPSDFAAMLGYLRRGAAKQFFAGLHDWLSPAVKNGLAERSDPGPGRAYYRQLFANRRNP